MCHVSACPRSCRHIVLVLHCRLANQVSVLYEDVLRLLSCDPLRSHFDRSWTAHVQVKATLYEVESQLQMGVQLHKDDEIGQEIARLKVGLTADAASVMWLAHASNFVGAAFGRHKVSLTAGVTARIQ